MAEPDFEALLKRLVDADIGFVVVGGLAVGTWGVVRGTRDVDIVPDPSPENLARLAQLSEELGGRVQMQEAFIGSAASIEKLLLAGERTLIETELGPLDVVHGLDGVPTYAELRELAVDTEVAGVPLLVCGLEHLRAMKRAAGRTRDLADLEDLDAATES